MLIPDINILLYASDHQSSLHRESRQWWQEALRGSRPIGLCAPVVFGYVRQVTHPRICRSPFSVEEAFEQVDNWLESPVAQWIEPDEAHLGRIKAMLMEAGTGGDLVTDAQIAAYGQQYNATVCSADSDFRRFNVKWLNPLARR